MKLIFFDVDSEPFLGTTSEAKYARTLIGIGAVDSGGSHGFYKTMLPKSQIHEEVLQKCDMSVEETRADNDLTIIKSFLEFIKPFSSNEDVILVAHKNRRFQATFLISKIHAKMMTGEILSIPFDILFYDSVDLIKLDLKYQLGDYTETFDYVANSERTHDAFSEAKFCQIISDQAVKSLGYASLDDYLEMKNLEGSHGLLISFKKCIQTIRQWENPEESNIRVVYYDIELCRTCHKIIGIGAIYENRDINVTFCKTINDNEITCANHQIKNSLYLAQIGIKSENSSVVLNSFLEFLKPEYPGEKVILVTYGNYKIQAPELLVYITEMSRQLFCRHIFDTKILVEQFQRKDTFQTIEKAWNIFFETELRAVSNPLQSADFNRVLAEKAATLCDYPSMKNYLVRNRASWKFFYAPEFKENNKWYLPEQDWLNLH